MPASTSDTTARLLCSSVEPIFSVPVAAFIGYPHCGAVIYAHPLAQSCTACVKADRAAHMRNARAIRAKERGHDLMHRDCAAPGCDKSVRIWGNAQQIGRAHV